MTTTLQQPQLEIGGHDGVKIIGELRHGPMLNLTTRKAEEMDMKMSGAVTPKPYSANFNTPMAVSSRYGPPWRWRGDGAHGADWVLCNVHEEEYGGWDV